MVGVAAEARLCRPVMLVQGLTELVDVSEQDSGGFRLRALDKNEIFIFSTLYSPKTSFLFLKSVLYSPKTSPK